MSEMPQQSSKLSTVAWESEVVVIRCRSALVLNQHTFFRADLLKKTPAKLFVKMATEKVALNLTLVLPLAILETLDKKFTRHMSPVTGHMSPVTWPRVPEVPLTQNV